MNPAAVDVVLLLRLDAASPMEYEQPWAPTLPHNRLPALRMYIEGEEMCNSGRVKEGVACFKRAVALAWELGSEDWPGWASGLYNQLYAGEPGLGAVAEEPVALLTRDTTSLQPELSKLAAAGLGGKVDVVDAVASALRARNFAVVDRFMGGSLPAALREASAAAWWGGELHMAKVAAPGDGYQGSASALTRSDSIAWVDAGAGAEERWAPLQQLVARVDSLVLGVGSRHPELGGRGASRMRPMISRYGPGAAFARHCDNHCANERGPHCNGRWLTAVYYCNEWTEEVGGCLRLYRPQVAHPTTGAEVAEAGGDVLCDVGPLSDRERAPSARPAPRSRAKAPLALRARAAALARFRSAVKRGAQGCFSSSPTFAARTRCCPSTTGASASPRRSGTWLLPSPRRPIKGVSRSRGGKGRWEGFFFVGFAWEKILTRLTAQEGGRRALRAAAHIHVGQPPVP